MLEITLIESSFALNIDPIDPIKFIKLLKFDPSVA